MLQLTIQEYCMLMDKPTNIRNLAIFAHQTHGATTLAETLLTSTGIALEGGDQDRVNAIVNSLFYQIPNLKAEEQKVDTSEFLINLVNNQLDSSPTITPTLSLIDGALVVVDVVEDVCIQTESLLRHTLAERIKPAVVLNKLDLALLDLKLSKEDLYQALSGIVGKLNNVISTYTDVALGDLQVHPERGTVAFASALYGWGFTLRQFALKYSLRFGIDADKMMARLWGDQFFDQETRKWTSKSATADGRVLERSFNMFVLDPIYKIFSAAVESSKDLLWSILAKLEIRLTETERVLEGTALINAIMRTFLPADDAILNMVVVHLPSPVTAQRYRVSTLYEGSMEDECAVGIRACDPSAPLMLYVTKMIPNSEVDSRRFYAMGRVFSGTVRVGQTVRVLGPKYVPGRRSDVFVKPIAGVVLMLGGRVHALEDCPAGNIVGLLGIDQFLLRSGTLTTSETAHNMRTIKYSGVPTVQVSVGVEKPADLPSLVEGLKRLSKADSTVEVSTSESGDHLIAAAGEAHLDALIKDLTEAYARVPLIVSSPLIQYRESIAAESSATVLTKSMNKHNRLYVRALPLDAGLTAAIEAGQIDTQGFLAPDAHAHARARMLADEYGWDAAAARKIWTFGPDGTGANVLVDTTRGVQYLHEIRDACIAGFQWATKEGVYAEEPMRGVRIDILDATLMGDAIHRGAGQIIPTMRRAVYAASLLAQPVLQEPVYLIEFQCPDTALAELRSCLTTRRAEIFSEEARAGASRLRAYVPVKDSFGFSAALRNTTNGTAFMQSEFDHWADVPGSPLEKGSVAGDILTRIRTRKGLSADIPPLETYRDKL
ncbi:eukaryotic translation elongation factor 2 [Mycena polygramma]|nr:eukaryotic translation elongation factor 2 [Mycena polygramma]